MEDEELGSEIASLRSRVLRPNRLTRPNQCGETRCGDAQDRSGL